MPWIRHPDELAGNGRGESTWGIIALALTGSRITQATPGALGKIAVEPVGMTKAGCTRCRGKKLAVNQL